MYILVTVKKQCTKEAMTV